MINSIKILKNPKAQLLLQKKQILINGVEINLWTGQNKDLINLQSTWNKISSYSDLNKNSTGENGTIVFSGIMQISREEASICARDLGFFVRRNVSSKTDFIIVGCSNVSPTKVSKALELNNKGANIQFIDENLFLDLITENIDLLPIELSSSKKNPIRKDNVQTKSNRNTRKSSQFSKIKINKKSDKLAGLTIVASGKLQNFSRDEIKQVIEDNGGKPVSSVSKKTDYLLAGENIGPNKLEKAKTLGIPVITEEDFLKILES